MQARIRHLLLLTLVSTICLPLRASLVYYTNESTFNSNLGSLSQINSATSFSAYNGFLGTSLTNANGTGINFLGFNGVNPDNLSITGGKLFTTLGGDKVEIDFPGSGSVYALGFHLTTPSSFGNWCISPITSSGCDNSVLTFGPSDIEFFGLISDKPLSTSFIIRPNSGVPIFEMVDFRAETLSAPSGNLSSTPEPGTLLLMGSGIAFLLLTKRRRQQAAEPSERSRPVRRSSA